MASAAPRSHSLEELSRRGVKARALAIRVWRSHWREIVAALAILFAAIVAASLLLSTEARRVPVTPHPPAPPPMLVRSIAPDQAVKVNASIPVSGSPNPAARPFLFKGTAGAKAQALNCLASAVYYEAGNQDIDGQRAVAQVVLNRVRHPAFPGSVCSVVYEGSTKETGCQFTFTCDNSLTRQPDAEGWRRATSVAEDALNGFVYGPVGWATHYHADYVVPVWASSMAKNAVVGAHLFYRWAGSWGQPGAFTKPYVGHEPSATALRTAALAVPHITPSYSQRQLATAIKQIPGAQALKLAPSLRGDKRIAVRFNLAARKASDSASHVDYAKQFAVSENLKWSLSGEPAPDNQRPLGSPAATPEGSGSAQNSGQH